MNNRYFGNIHDFCKYGLLRRLAFAGFRLGVCWMLTPPSGKSESGYDYLRRGYLRSCDQILFDWLGKQLGMLERGEMDEREWGMGLLEGDKLIYSAEYFGKPIPAAIPGRNQYFEQMFDQFQQSGRDLVFLDPDFGLGTTAREITGEQGRGYLRASEAAACFKSGFSVLFYQDWRPAFEEAPTRKVREALHREGIRAPILEFEASKRYEGRNVEETGTTYARFFLIQQPEHAARVSEFVESFQQSPWCVEKVFVAPQPASLPLSRPVLPAQGSLVASGCRVGIFIDGENSYGVRKIRYVLDNIRQIVPQGKAVYGRVFGKPDAVGGKWKIGGKKYPYFVRPLPVDKGEDESEVAMSADINEQIAKGKVDAVIVFAKDKLNRPSARFARNRSIPFYGIGDEAGSTLSYRQECTKFFSVVKDGRNFRLNKI